MKFFGQLLTARLATLTLAFFHFPSIALTASHDGAESIILGNASVEIDTETISRVTGRRDTNATATTGTRISILWPDALLDSVSQTRVRIRMRIELTIGQSMPVGGHTPYPGVITKVDRAYGEIVDLQTRHALTLRLSERGSWIGKLIHSDSHGPNHLALELPFSLFDRSTGALVAENNLVAAIDLASQSTPFIGWSRLSPVPFADLRLGTTDVGGALKAPVSGTGYTPAIPVETYTAQAAVTNARAILDKNQHSDLFDARSQSHYTCSSEQFMELELRSSGLAQSGKIKSPPFTLQLRYVPALIADGQLAFLDPLDGRLTLHYQNSNRVIEVGPGNHGEFSSKAVLDDGRTGFQLAVALREGTEPPVVARLLIECGSSDEKLDCGALTLSTAIDSDGNIMTLRALSDLLESLEAHSYFDAAKRTQTVQPLGGGPTPCPFFCPRCRPEGCSGGICTVGGAPLNCTAGCDHHPNTPQCCSSTGKLCCVLRCATPP